MTSALPSPEPVDLLTRWTVQPVALVAAAALVVWYLRAAGGVPGWPARRTAWLLCGVALFVWATCGFGQVYGGSLYWVWMAQALALLLVVPLVVLAGRPLELSRAVSGPDGPAGRLLASRPVQVLSSPLVGPALVPALSFLLFFGPLPAWAIGLPPVGWVLQVALVALGGLIVLRLVGTDDSAGSLAVGLALGLGVFELALASVPGLVIRLQNSLVTSYFDHRAEHEWALAPLRDQHLAGGVLWSVSEVIAIPFLLLAFRRWLRADARDAAVVDAVLEAERIARADVAPGTGPADTPWWLADRAMQQRLNQRD